MSSYHLPIVLGQNQSERIVVIHLVDDSETYEENRVVIVSPAGISTPLFKISDQAQLIPIGGNLVKPQFDKGANLVTVSVQGKLISPKRADGFWNYRVNSGVFDDEVLFSVTVTENSIDVTYQGKLHIVRHKAGEMVMRINADLGSDATQINYFVPGTGVNKSQGINLVKCFKDAYLSDRRYDTLKEPESHEPLFMQQEAMAPYFYKTGNITFQVNGKIDEPIEKSETFINYINVSAAGKNENLGKGADTWDHESGFNRKLINIKMLYAHSNMPEVTGPVANIHFLDNGSSKPKYVANQQNLLQVLQTIYRQLIEVSTEEVAQGCKLFSVLLLVPNIYVQENIDLLLYEMNKMNKNDKGLKYDFRIISESDSAFVGIKEAPVGGGTETILSGILNKIRDPRQKDAFLVIDAGKGTTDYSIVSYDSNMQNEAYNSMIPMRRGGIVGAGGAIDYVFARVFARQIYNHRQEIVGKESSHVAKSEFIHRFMTLIEKLKPVDQDRMMLIVETLKKNYKVNSGKTAKAYTCFAGDSAKAIVSTLLNEKISNEDLMRHVKNDDPWAEIAKWVWDNQTIETDAEDKAEVEWVCTAIAQTIINEMIFDKKDDSLNRKIDFIIFTGRSFIFEPLKKAFQDAIEGSNHGYRGIWFENWGIWAYALRLRPKESYYNLKIAPLSGFNMKSVSVSFQDHDLGVNCNSDLCCMDGIELSSGEIFGQDKFWNGFTAVQHGHEQLHHYIGYVSGNIANSFAPYLGQKINNADNMTDTRRKLVLMTLFPVSYMPTFEDKEDPETNTPTNETTNSSTSHNSSSDDDNDSNSSSGDNSNMPGDNDNHLDRNDL